MASPVDVARTATPISTAGTSHAINTGTPSSGELLVCLLRTGVNPGTLGGELPGGTWTVAGTSDAADAADDFNYIFAKIADGSEGATDTFTTVNSTKLAAIVWRISGVATSGTIIEYSTAANFTTTANTANPASVSVTGGPKDVLYLALMGKDGSAVPTGAPTNYVNLITASATGGGAATQVGVGGASRAIAASSSDDPGVFTHAAANAGGNAWTAVIHPYVFVPSPNLLRKRPSSRAAHRFLIVR